MMSNNVTTPYTRLRFKLLAGLLLYEKILYLYKIFLTRTLQVEFGFIPVMGLSSLEIPPTTTTAPVTK